MPNTTQIGDILFKKMLGLGTTQSGRQFFNEPIGGRSFVVNDQIWGQSDQIPNTAPASSSGVVQRVTGYQLTVVAGTTNSFSGVLLRDAIPFNWGDGTSYNYAVTDSTSASISFGVNDWVVDTEAGILMFNNGAPANMPPYISFYRYSGIKGPDTGSFISTGQTGHVHSQYALVANTGQFITTAQTGHIHTQYYLASNPAGYITSASISGAGVSNVAGLSGVITFTGGGNVSVYTGAGNIVYVSGATGNLVFQGMTGHVHSQYTLNSNTGLFYPASNPLGFLSGVITDPQTDDSLIYNGVTWVNRLVGSRSAGAATTFYLDDTTFTGGNASLLSVPTGGAEDIDICIVNNSIPFVPIDKYVSTDYIGGTQIDGGVWVFNLYAKVDSSAGISKIISRINKRVQKTGIAKVSGVGLNRAVTISGGNPFVSGDANTDITLATVLETPNASFWITGFTSSNSAKLQALSTGDLNETGNFSLYYFLFKNTGEVINSTTVPTLLKSFSVQPTFTGINATDRITAGFFATTTSASSITFSLYHNGTEHYSHIISPIITRHNTLAGLQGGDASGYFHLTQNEYTNLVTGTVIRPSDTGQFAPIAQTGHVHQQYALGSSTGDFITTGESRDLRLDGFNLMGNFAQSLPSQNSISTFYYPNIATYTATESQIGAIVLNTPISRSGNLSTLVHIRGYNFKEYKIENFFAGAYTSVNSSGNIDGVRGYAQRASILDLSDNQIVKSIGINKSGCLAIAINTSNSTAFYDRYTADVWVSNMAGVINISKTGWGWSRETGINFDFKDIYSFTGSSFVPSSGTGQFITTAQTGHIHSQYVSASETGQFVSASQTGHIHSQYALSANTGQFVIAQNTGAFLTITSGDSRYWGGIFNDSWHSFFFGSMAGLSFITDNSCPVGTSVLQTSGLVWPHGPKIPLDTTLNYEVEFWYNRITTGSPSGYLYSVVSNYNASGNIIRGDGEDWCYPSATQHSTISTGWHKFHTIVGPQGVKAHCETGRFISVGFITNLPSGDEVWRWAGFKCLPITSGLVFSSQTGTFVNTSMTGHIHSQYVLSSSTGSFITSGQIIKFNIYLTSGVDSQVINYPVILPAKPTAISCEIENSVDDLIYSRVLSSVNTSGFTINFSDDLSSSGYLLSSTIFI